VKTTPEGRKWKNDEWLSIYYQQRKHNQRWSNIFLLVLALIGVVLIVLPLFGTLARP
jgi:predicted nucleic acid-binding Zn ribbon protein